MHENKELTELWLILLILYGLTAVTHAGLPLNRYEAMMKQETTGLGLYDESDKVVILNKKNFNDLVQQQNRSTLVEFYNSYCGHCRRFAPIYKTLAERIYGWRSLLIVSAIDCAVEDNNDICREYEIMGYPTLRYLTKNFTAAPEHYGRNFETQDPKEIRVQLAIWLAEENTHLQALTYEQAEHYLTSEINDNEVLTFVLFVPENSTFGIQTALYFAGWPHVQILHTSEAKVAALFNLSSNGCAYAIWKNVSNVVCDEAADINTTKFYENFITKQLAKYDVTETPQIAISSSTASSNKIIDDVNNEIISFVKRQKHLIYQADLELALRQILLNEIPRAVNISGERHLALKRMLTVLQRYLPASKFHGGYALIKHLNEFVNKNPQTINGSEFAAEIRRVEAEDVQDIFSATRFVGCMGSRPELRGFTCSLWQLFHFLTVQSAVHNHTDEAIDVLEAIHGYVKHFFGCTDCSEHFQAMAVRRHIWDVDTKDKAVLWLWEAHNEVNARLAGDSTEDPEFPKISFPSRESCSQCYLDHANNSLKADNWNKTAVLSFLKNIHNPQFISQFGLKTTNSNETSNSPFQEQLRQKRMIAFSDLDLRVGMLLYASCIMMIVVAFKLFMFKGSFRKKALANDVLGKV